MSDLILYTNPMSRGRIARWALEEVGARYDVRVMNYADTMKGDDYLAVNPMGKVPAIVHKGKVVTECAAICAYLGDAFPEAGLAPGLSDRADYYRWLFFAAGPVEHAVTNNSAGFVPQPEQGRMFGYGSYDQAIDVLEQGCRHTIMSRVTPSPWRTSMSARRSSGATNSARSPSATPSPLMRAG